ncbi:transporter [Spirochaetia bacterium]|nr:transporter [Spirochaetia bacterium]
MIQTFRGSGGRLFKTPISATLKPVRISALCLALGFALGGTALFGQEAAGQPASGGGTAVRRISPDEAVDLAIKSNLSLESSRVSAGTKKRAADTAWNVFIPTVDISGSLIRPNKATTVSGTQPVGPSDIPGVGTVYDYVVPYSITVDPSWRMAGSLQVSLNINFAMFEAMKRLRLDYEGGLLSYEKARAQLERDVRKSYYQMLLLIENIELLRENYTAAENRVETARANYRAGLAPELTLLQAQVAVENMKPTIDQAENGLKLSMAQFAFNLGLPYDTQFELIPADEDTTFIPLDVAELIHRASSGKPDIQELKQSLQVLQSARKATMYQMYTPSLSLGWNMDPTFKGDPFKDKLFEKDSWAQQSGMFRVTLAFQLNSLLPFSSGAQNLKNLDDNIQSLNIGLAQSIRGTELEIYNTVLSLEKARTTVEAQAFTVDLAERSYRLTEDSYRAGYSALLDVQNAELELRRARIGVLEQNFNYLMGLIDLEYAIGAPFGSLSSTENAK